MLNIPGYPIVNKYREGMVKRTSGRGVKKNVKLQAYKQKKNEL